jgi:drug/metabolite transporter (DMT)-like permease
VSTTLGWSLISTAMRQIPATVAGLVLLLQPALSFVWDVLIFHRPTAVHEVFGVVLILGAIFQGSRRA